MKTIFDLRENKDDEIYEAIRSVYNEPLNLVKIEEQSITSCIGCWSCWLKTPGKCVMNDKMSETYMDYINSDTVILLIDAAQGFINHRAKAFFDRTICHYHPYIELIDGECHHVARYKSYPNMAFYFETKDLSNQEDQVIEDYLYRTAYQFKSKAYRLVMDGCFEMKRLESRAAKRQIVPFSSVEPMEKLVIYNGSPRMSGSNSSFILNKILKDFGDKVEIRDLKKRDKWKEWAEAFRDDKNIMFFMPLYVHAMPSHVMKFIEQVKASKGSISFFVQSGFPESSQSHYLEAYFEQLSIRLGRTYLGTAIKGGVEGLQIRSSKAQEKTIDSVENTIVNLVNEGEFNKANIKQLSEPIRFGGVTKILFKLFTKFNLINFFWDQQLKENKAYENRFDTPYLS